MAFYLGDKKAANVIAYFDKNIIEVSELPTENIHEDRVYAVVEGGQYLGFYTREGGEWVNFEPPSGDSPEKYIEAKHETVDLPNATTIKPYAFYADDTMESINMPNVIEIGRAAFDNCNKLKLTTLPVGLRKVSYGSFNFCTSMTVSELPSSLVELGERSFRRCEKINITSIHDGITDIPNDCFYGCYGLTSIKLPSTIKSIGSTAFSGCTNLTAIYVPWEEGEVANEPWGATNASIYYDA